MLHIEPHPQGPRLYWRKPRARLHHAIGGWLLVALGLALVWHDRHDYPWLQD